VAGVLAIADTIKPDARAAISELRSSGIEPVMLTGDNRRTAEAVAAQVGIEEIHAQMLPEDKADHIREIRCAYVISWTDNRKSARLVMSVMGQERTYWRTRIMSVNGGKTDVIDEKADILCVAGAAR